MRYGCGGAAIVVVVIDEQEYGPGTPEYAAWLARYLARPYDQKIQAEAVALVPVRDRRRRQDTAPRG